MHYTVRTTLGILVLALAGLSASLIAPRPALSQSGTSIIGYLWSDSVGWIDLNCLNTNSCGTNNFGFSVNSGGVITGYAWSDNIGWISANGNDINGCPNSPCTAKLTGTTISGWIRALSGGTAQSGGWDGFISLGGPSYSITYDPTLNYFTGYGWGDANMGWIDSSRMRLACAVSYSCIGQQIYQVNAACQKVAVGPVCTFPTFCVDGSSVCLYPQPTGTLAVNPKLVVSGKSTVVTWNMSGVSTTTSPCVLTSSRGTDSATGSTGSYTAANIRSQTTFTLTCTPLDPAAGSTFVLHAVTSLVPNYVEQ